MIYRLSCAAVIVFWLVMTAMLVMRAYFSSEDRLPLVKDADEVVELFIKNPNTSNLNVYRDRKQVGSISITPKLLSNGNRQLMMTALGEIDFPAVDKQDVGWRGELELTPSNEVEHFDLTVTFSKPQMKVALLIDPKTFDIKYLVEHKGERLIDSDDRNSKHVKRVQFLLGLWGFSPEKLRKKEESGEGIAGDDAISVRFGKVEIGGERQTAYIVYLAPMRGREFKVYFSETGEILKIGAGSRQGKDQVWGYEILSEGFKIAKPGAGEDEG
ncbi:MAG: hypothetical protein ACR2RV_01970 [Verrucomicrobiales bacterium]